MSEADCNKCLHLHLNECEGSFKEHNTLRDLLGKKLVSKFICTDYFPCTGTQNGYKYTIEVFEKPSMKDG